MAGHKVEGAAWHRIGSLFIAATLSFAVGCASAGAPDSSHDAGKASDLGSFLEDNIPDMAHTADLATSDLHGAATGDMSYAPDLAKPADLSLPPDLSTCGLPPGSCTDSLCIVACGLCGQIGICSNDNCHCL